MWYWVATSDLPSLSRWMLLLSALTNPRLWFLIFQHNERPCSFKANSQARSMIALKRRSKSWMRAKGKGFPWQRGPYRAEMNESHQLDEVNIHFIAFLPGSLSCNPQTIPTAKQLHWLQWDYSMMLGLKTEALNESGNKHRSHVWKEKACYIYLDAYDSQDVVAVVY